MKIRGRPKLKIAEKKQVFSMRLSPERRAAYERAAKRENLSLREWMEKALDEAMD